MEAWPPGARAMTDADLAFRPVADEEYTESMSLDAESADGVRASATLAATNMGIGDGSAGVRATLKVNGRTWKTSEEPERWQRQRDALRLHVGGTRVHGTLGEIRIEHANKEFGFELTFRPLAPAWRPGSGRTTFGADRKRFYEYSLPMPLARVEGRVRTGSAWRAFSGIGAVDHSRVNLYPHEQAARWYRFRARTERGLVQFSTFEAAPRWGGRTAGWVVVADEGRILHESTKIRVDLLDHRPDPDKPANRIPWKYTFSDGGALRGDVSATRRISRLEYLSTMGAIKRWIVSRFADPIGYSLAATYDAELRLPGGARRLAGTGEMSQTFIH
jgi:hypothetical protein